MGLLALALPVIFHGAFDFFLFPGYPGLQVAGALVSFFIAIRQHQARAARHAAGGNDHE